MSDLAKAESIIRAEVGDRLRTGFPLSPLTTFRIGGPAALYLEVASEADLAAVSRAKTETSIAIAIVGKGSNLLVADAGFEGLVLRLGRGYRWSAREADQLVAGGSMPLPALAGVALQHRLAGLEFGVAIPATLGGAVRMNAGAHGREIAEVVVAVEVFRLDEAIRVSVPVEDAGFSYRRSALGEAAVVLGARLILTPGDPEQIRASMREARSWRRRTQPLAEPNCGSVFKNPPGDHAARLIDEAGAKGRRVGGASVSTKHANFIVAEPGARAEDVVALIRQIQQLVQERSGVRLDTEVQLVGTFA